MITLENIRKKKIVVYGTGVNAVKSVYFLEQENIKIEYIIDGRTGTGRFKNYKVYQPSADTLDGKYIVVACSPETYPAIKQRLKAYKEFEDYMFFGWLNKKMVFLHGNCHMDIIESFLQSSEKFQNKYAIYPTPRICTGERVNEQILCNMDIWIHEDIQVSNRFGYKVSDEYIKKYMAPNVTEIVIPHLYGLGAGFFPHTQVENSRNTALLNGAYENGMFPDRDDIIERCMELCVQNRTDIKVKEIYQFSCEDGIIPEEYIKSNFEKYISKIKQREKVWDIKILDFILQHYKHEKLFYDKGHPTNVILKKISEEILKILKIRDEVTSDKTLDIHEVPIYPWIKKVLGMEWKEEFIRVHAGSMKAAPMNVLEYIREYIWWCYPDIEL